MELRLRLPQRSLAADLDLATRLVALAVEVAHGRRPAAPAPVHLPNPCDDEGCEFLYGFYDNQGRLWLAYDGEGVITVYPGWLVGPTVLRPRLPMTGRMHPREPDLAHDPDALLLARAIEALAGAPPRPFAALCRELRLGAVDLGAVGGADRRLAALLTADLQRNARRDRERLRGLLATAQVQELVVATGRGAAATYAATALGQRWSVAAHTAAARRHAAGLAPRQLAAQLCVLLCADPEAGEAVLAAELLPAPAGPDDSPGRRAYFAALRRERPAVLATATSAAVALGWLGRRDGRLAVTPLGAAAAAAHLAEGPR